jgi:hypothetical protein
MGTYKAITRGYVDGEIREAGEVFTTTFVAPVRENGKPVIKDGVVQTVEIDPPSWVEVLSKAEAKRERDTVIVEEQLVGPDMKPIAQAAAKFEAGAKADAPVRDKK